MADEEFVDVKYSSGLSSRDSFVMEPAESSPVVNTQTGEPEMENPTDQATDMEGLESAAGAPKEGTAGKISENQHPGPWSNWGTTLYSVASSSVKAFEHGVAKVLDVIEDDGGKEASSPKIEEPKVSRAPPEHSMLPTGMKDDLRTLSSAVQKTSGKLVNSGFSMLSALGKRTLEVLVAEEEGIEGSLPHTDSSLSSRIREAKAMSMQQERDQRRQLAYWFDLSGGNDSFEAFRCFSQSSLHSIHGKFELCEVQGEEGIVPQSYKKISEVLSASSDRLIREWDKADFAKNAEEGDLLDGEVFAKLLKDRLSMLNGPSDRLCSALEKAKKDLLATDLTQDSAYEGTLQSLANFTTAAIDYLHKNVQLLHASALSNHAVQTQPGKDSVIRSECNSVLEVTASFSTACLVLALRIRAISLAGKSAVLKTISETSVQPDEESSPELAVTSLDMEATDCAAHLAKILAFLGPVLQHLLLLRIYGADCCPPVGCQDEEESDK